MEFLQGFSECWWPGPTCRVQWSAVGAMAQAVLSALAILAAWALQEREQRIAALRESQTILELMKQLASMGRKASEFAEACAGGQNYAEFDYPLFALLKGTVGEVEVGRVRLPSLALPVLRARRAANQLASAFEQARRSREEPGLRVPESLLGNIRENCEALQDAYRVAICAHNEYAQRRWGLAAFKVAVTRNQASR